MVVKDYWMKNPYRLVIWLDGSCRDSLLKDLIELAKWFRFSIIEEWLDFDDSALAKRLFQRLSEDKTLLVIKQCSTLLPLQASKLHKLCSENCHILIPVQSPIGSINLQIYKPTLEFSWMSSKCKLFLSLMAFIHPKCNSILASVVMHSAKFVPEDSDNSREALKEVLIDLVSRKLIQFSPDNKTIEMVATFTTKEFNNDNMLMSTWIEVLESTNDFHMPYEHQEQKLHLFSQLNGHNFWTHPANENLKPAFLEALIKFVGFWKGEHYISPKEFNFYHFEKHNSHCQLLKALLNKYPPQLRYRDEPTEDRRLSQKNANAAMIEFDFELDQLPQLIAQHCYAYYLMETDFNKAIDLLTDCQAKLESLNILNSHPLALTINYTLATALCLAKRYQQAESLLQPCYLILKALYKCMEEHPALTETTYQLGVVRTLTNQQHQAALLFKESLSNQLKGKRLTSYTINTIAGVLETHTATMQTETITWHGETPPTLKRIKDKLNHYWDIGDVSYRNPKNAFPFGEFTSREVISLQKENFIEVSCVDATRKHCNCCLEKKRPVFSNLQRRLNISSQAVIIANNKYLSSSL